MKAAREFLFKVSVYILLSWQQDASCCHDNKVILICLDNKLKELPGSVCSMKSLRMLDLQENDITMLPRQLCHVRTMETLALDIDKMRYPPPGEWDIQYFCKSFQLCKQWCFQCHIFFFLRDVRNLFLWRKLDVLKNLVHL